MSLKALSIVIVEDNDALRESLRLFLSQKNWHVRACAHGAHMDDLFRLSIPDVLLLDVNLPYEDGLSISRRVRAEYPGMGIVMLSARINPEQRALGYKDGADVYIAKPADLHELEFAIGNLGARVKPAFATGHLVLNVKRSQLFSTGHLSATLTQQELQLLRSLDATAERATSADDLCAALGSPTEPMQRNNLNVLISRFRAKVHAQLAVPDLIKAVRGQGYRLTVPLRDAEDDGARNS